MAPSQVLADGRKHGAQLHTSTDACMPSHCATCQFITYDAVKTFGFLITITQTEYYIKRKQEEIT
jgi:hypothetical protein